MSSMQISIEPRSQLPVYAQLKEQIKFLILSGDVEPGAKLPTSRQLAGFLNINRNTVLKAYQELVREGLIECRRGAGCTVVDQPVAIGQSVFGRLLAVIDDAIEQAGELGIAPDDFAALAYSRAKQRRDVHAKRRLMFVECERPIANALAQRIQEKLELEVTPAVLRDLEEPTPELEELLHDAEVIATTFSHIEEVRELLPKMKKKLVALSVKPHLDSLIEIAGIPKSTPVLLVCVTEYCAAKMQEDLDGAGIKGLQYSLCGANNPQRLAEALREHPVIIASHWAADEVVPLVGPDQKSIVLDYSTVDEAAIYLLRSIIGEESSTM